MTLEPFCEIEGRDAQHNEDFITVEEGSPAKQGRRRREYRQCTRVKRFESNLATAKDESVVHISIDLEMKCMSGLVRRHV